MINKELIRVDILSSQKRQKRLKTLEVISKVIKNRKNVKLDDLLLSRIICLRVAIAK